MRQRMQTTNQILLAAEEKERERVKLKERRKSHGKLFIIIVIIATNTCISWQQTLDFDLMIHHARVAD